MTTRIEITVGEISLSGELNDTSTAREVADSLPVEASPNFWGDEIYFGLPVDISENEQPETDMEVGTLAYWPEGNAFCIFFGPTPGSEGAKPKPASPVTVIGQLLDDSTRLRELDRALVQSVRVEGS